MGCDIHVHVELKINGQWHHWTTGRFERDYALFSRMAGVRAGGIRNEERQEAIAPNRGIPNDATFLTRFDSEHWGENGHSHSWVSSQEVAELEEWYSTVQQNHDCSTLLNLSLSIQLNWLFGNSYSGFAKYPEIYPGSLEDFRWVFWFDN